MRIASVIFLLLFLLSSSLQAQNDSVMYQRDSVIEVTGDCTESFFLNSERIADPSKISVIARNRRTYSLPRYLSLNNIGNFGEMGLSDLDRDGKKELIIFNYTGGAHCCDEIYIFRNVSTAKYQYVSKLFGGHTCFTPQNRLIFSFYEHFGYFFTCYACSYEDTSDTAPIPVSSVQVEYVKGKLIVTPGDASLRSMIRDNLDKLSEQPYVEMDEISQDNGLRKEFALNLAVYYYSFGRDINATRRLFNSFYKFPDSRKVWKEFYGLLMNLRKTNDF